MDLEPSKNSRTSIFSEKTLYVKADFRVLTLYTYNTWRQKNKNKICTSRNLNSSETCKIWSEILLRFRKIKWKVKFLHAYLLSISKFCSTSNQILTTFFAQNILFYKENKMRLQKWNIISTYILSRINILSIFR